MSNFRDEILNGLEYIHVSGLPGVIVTFGQDAQPIITGQRNGTVVIAAVEIGAGRVVACAHDYFLKVLTEKQTDPQNAKFSVNVKNWLKKGEVPETIRYGSVGKIDMNNLNDYDILKWHHDNNITTEDFDKLKEYLEAGGALYCAATVWGFLQVYGNKTIDDISMYRFLKTHCGILLNDDCIGLPLSRLVIRENKAENSNFALAVEQASGDIDEISHICDVLACGVKSLEKAKSLDPVLIARLKDLLNAKCAECNLNSISSAKNPVKDTKAKSITNLLGMCYISSNGEKAPGIDAFPGDFENEPKILTEMLIDIETKFNEHVSTGYYVQAGRPVNLKVISGKIKGWSVLIGAHTDDLTNCDCYKRWPNIYIRKPITGEELEVSSPFGGLLYLISPNNGGKLTLTVDNVVEAPFFDLTLPATIFDWSRRRQEAEGLWADIAGEHIIFTVPSACIRNLENPMAVLKFWDSVVATHHQCRGSDVTKQRRERVVCDVQPSCGYMHSGYPVVTHLDQCETTNPAVFNLTKLKAEGSWGIFHEIGHNMQRGEWTFDGTGEVTVNIFSMHAMEFVVGKQVYEQSWLKDNKQEIQKYLAGTPAYDKWKKLFGVGLMTFAQLIKHFGWDEMKKFMAEYEVDIKKRQNMPKTNQDKIDQWVVRYSKLVNRNIKPHFQFWGLPVSSAVDEKLEGLEPWSSPQDFQPTVDNFFKP